MRPGQAAAQVIVLTRAFVDRFFEGEAFGAAHARKAAFFALLAVLAIPGVAAPVFLAWASTPVLTPHGYAADPSGWGWLMVARYQGPEALRLLSRPDKALYLGYAMCAAGLLAVLTWNGLGLDRRDALVLGPLPLRTRTVVLAKMLALAVLAAAAGLTMHALSALAFGILLASGSTLTFAIRGIAAHFVVATAASLFVLLAVTALAGLVQIVLGPAGARRVAPVLQLALGAALAASVLALPALPGAAAALERTSAALPIWPISSAIVPPLWFLGLYERLLGTDDPALLALARMAVAALVAAAAATLLTYPLACRRMLASAVQQSGRARGGIVTAAAELAAALTAREPRIRGLASFLWLTMLRAPRQRTVLACAAGVAVALAVPEWRAYLAPVQPPTVASLCWITAWPLLLVAAVRLAAALPGDLAGAWVFDVMRPARAHVRAAVERVMATIGALAILAGAWVCAWAWGWTLAAIHAGCSGALTLILMQGLLRSVKHPPCAVAWSPARFNWRVLWPALPLGMVLLTRVVPGLELLAFHYPTAGCCAMALLVATARRVRAKDLTRPAVDLDESFTESAIAFDVGHGQPATLSGVPSGAPAAVRKPGTAAAEAPFTWVAKRKGSLRDVDWPRLARFGAAGLRRSVAALPRDLALAWRRLRAAPVFAAFSILTFAVGVGTTTVAVAIVRALVWSPAPPTAAALRLVAGTRVTTKSRTTAAFSWPDFMEVRRHQRSFQSLAAMTPLRPLALTGSEGLSEIVQGEAVSGDYFQTFGLRPALGRLLQPADDVPGATPVVVLSNSLWRLRFGADRSVAGRTLLFDGRPYVIAGVAPEAFRGWDWSNYGRPAAVWVPFATAPEEVQTRVAAGDPDTRWVVVKGRLNPGRSADQASAELGALGRATERTLPTRGAPAETGSAASHRVWGRDWSVQAIRETNRAYVAIRNAGTFAVALIGLVFLIGCTNLANLALARGADHERDVAVRLALGASRSDIAREHLVETGLLVTAGAVLTWLAVRMTLVALTMEIRVVPVQFLLLRPHVDGMVLAAALASGVTALAMIGLWPALLVSRPGAGLMAPPSGGATPPHWRLHQRVMTWQVAAATLLFVLAAACVSGLMRFADLDPGFAMDRLAVAGFSLDANHLTSARAREILQTASQSIAGHRGIRHVAIATGLPEGFWTSLRTVARADQSTGIAESAEADLIAVGPSTFETLGIHLLRGRNLSDRDDSPGSVVLNTGLARRLFGGDDPLGRTVLTRPESPPNGASQILTVIGIVSDTDSVRSGARDPGMLYVPIQTWPLGGGVLIARTSGDPRAAVPVLRRALLQAAPGLGIEPSGTAASVMGGPYELLRVVSMLASGLGALALGLSMTGLFGVISMLVSRRTREFGVRIALGANRGRIARLVLHDALRPVAAGLVFGLFAGALGRSMLRHLIGLRLGAVDLPSFAVVAALLVVAALAAAGRPAWRAAALDPAAVLKRE